MVKRILAAVADRRAAALAAATVVAFDVSQAQAATLGEIARNLITQLGDVGKLMVAGSFVGGLVMLATGLMKLKQAADTQGNQVKYSEGMWRCGVGAGLVAIPAFASVLGMTFFNEAPSISNATGF